MNPAEYYIQVEKELREQAWVEYWAKHLRIGHSPQQIVRCIRTYLTVWGYLKIPG